MTKSLNKKLELQNRYFSFFFLFFNLNYIIITKMPLDEVEDDDDENAISNEHILGIFVKILFRFTIN